MKVKFNQACIPGTRSTCTHKRLSYSKLKMSLWIQSDAVKNKRNWQIMGVYITVIIASTNKRSYAANECQTLVWVYSNAVTCQVMSFMMLYIWWYCSCLISWNVCLCPLINIDQSHCLCVSHQVVVTWLLVSLNIGHFICPSYSSGIQWS